MDFRHSNIFNNGLFAHNKDFLSSDDMLQYLLVLVSALYSHGIKHLFLYLIHLVVIEMVTIFPWPISSLRVSFSKSPKSTHYKLFEKNLANAISSQYDVQYMKTVASETGLQNILESLRKKR